MSYTNNNGSILADDVEKSSTLEDMYKMILGSGSDAPSSFGNFGFSSDEEDTLSKEAKLSESDEENEVEEEEKQPKKELPVEEMRPKTDEMRPKLSLPIQSRLNDPLAKRLSLPVRERLIDPLKPRLSLPREKPIIIKREQKPESSSSSEYEEETEDDDENEKEEDGGSETDHDYEYVISDVTSVPINNTDDVHPQDVITDKELDAILDMEESFDENTVVQPSIDAEVTTKIETPRLSHTEPIIEPNMTSSLQPTSTPLDKNFPAKAPSPEVQKRDSIPTPDIESNHKIVNGVQMTESDSGTTGTDSEEEPQVVVVQPPTMTPPVQTPKIEMSPIKEYTTETKPVEKQIEKPAKQVYSYHKKFRSDNTYKCCVCCLVTLFCFTIAAFIISLIALTDRCSCEDTTLLKSQLLQLMEERNCPAGWRAFNGSCYGISTFSKKSYINAKDSCRQYGANIVALTSRSENDYITKNILCPRSKQFNRDDSFFIGLEKKNVGSTSNIIYKYKWNTGEDLQFTNSISVTNSTKLCFQIKKSGLWTEVDCSAKLNVLCESKIVKLSQCG